MNAEKRLTSIKLVFTFKLLFPQNFIATSHLTEMPAELERSRQPGILHKGEIMMQCVIKPSLNNKQTF